MCNNLHFQYLLSEVYLFHWRYFRMAGEFSGIYQVSNMKLHIQNKKLSMPLEECYWNQFWSDVKYFCLLQTYKLQINKHVFNIYYPISTSHWTCSSNSICCVYFLSLFHLKNVLWWHKFAALDSPQNCITL